MSQDYTLLDVLDAHVVDQVVLQYPFELRLASGDSLLQVPGVPPQQTLRHATSGQLAVMCTNVARQWSLHVLMTEMVSVHTMKVTGATAFEPDAEAQLDAGLRAQLRAAARVNRMSEPSASAARAKPKPKPRSQPKRSANSGRSQQGVLALDGVIGEQCMPPEGAEEGGDELSDGPSAPDDRVQHVDHALVHLASGLLMQPVSSGALLGDEALADGGEAPIDWAQGDVPVAASSSGAPAPTSAGGAGHPFSSSAEAPGEALSGVLEEVFAAAGLSVAEPDAPSDEIVSPPSAREPRASSSSGPSVAPSPPAAPLPEAAVAIGSPIDGGPEGWCIRPGGYIHDADRRLRARITAWGSANVSIRKVGGPSKAVKRHLATDGQLVHWILSGFSEQLRPRLQAAPKAAAG